MKHYVTIKTTVLLCIVTFASWSGVLFGMQLRSGLLDEIKVNPETLAGLKKQARLQKYNHLYYVLDPLPRELVNLVLDYDEIALPLAQWVNEGIVAQQAECVLKTRAHNAPIQCVAPLSQGGCASAAGQEIKAWDQKGDLNKALNTNMQVKCMVQLANGDLCVGGCSLDGATQPYMKTTQMWDLGSYKRKNEMKDTKGEITCLTPVDSKNGEQWIALGASDGSLVVRHPVSKAQQSLQECGASILALVALAGQRLIANSDNKIQLWNWAQKHSLYQVDVEELASYSGLLVGTLNNCLMPISDSMIACAACIAQGASHDTLNLIHVDEKNNKITSLSHEGIFDDRIKTIIKLSHNLWVLVLIDGTGIPFTIDKKNMVQPVVDKNKNGIAAYSFGKNIVAVAVITNPTDWIVTANKQGELMWWR